MQVNYKEKYKELKLKIKDLYDLSFRLGVEEGLRQSQVQQAQQQQQAAEQQAQMSAQGGQPGQPGQDGQPQDGQPVEEQMGQQGGSELDNHISELESMLQKMEQGSSQYVALKKSIDGIRLASDARKAKTSIEAIAKALKKPFTMNDKAVRNMNEPAKKALNLQEQLISDITKGWAEEEQKVKEQVTKTLGIEGMLHKE